MRSELGNIPKSANFDQLVSHGDANSLGDLADHALYQDLKNGTPFDARAQEFKTKHGLTDKELDDLQAYASGATSSDNTDLNEALGKVTKMSGTTYRVSSANDATLQKLMSGQPLTTSDLTNGNSAVSTKVDGFAEGYNKDQVINIKYVVNSNSTADGSTWVAPLSPYGISESEAVYYTGTFSVNGAKQDSNGQWVVYLTHHA